MRRVLKYRNNSSSAFQLRIPAADIKATIFGHSEFTTFNESATRLYAKWKNAATPSLKGLTRDSPPKALIETISEDLLTIFQKAPLLDAYDVYQHLMAYWEETMQDDCYLVSGDGWKKAAQPQLIIDDKKNKSKTKPDFAIGKKKYTAELIPPALVIARYDPKDQAAIEAMEAEVAALEQELEEMAEEHGGEDGLLPPHPPPLRPHRPQNQRGRAPRHRADEHVSPPFSRTWTQNSPLWDNITPAT